MIFSRNIAINNKLSYPPYAEKQTKIMIGTQNIKDKNEKIDFIKLLNIRYDNAYDFLRVRSVDLDAEAKTVSVQIGVPYSGDKELNEEDKKKILSFAVEILPDEYTVSVSFRKFGVDNDIVFKLVKEYVNKFHRAYSVLLSSDNTEIVCGDKTVTVTFTVVKSVGDLFEKCGLLRGLKDYLDSSYDRVNMIKIRYTDEFIISETAKEEVPVVIDDCYIEISAVHKLCGSEITSKARYIRACTSPQSAVCVTGKVESIVARNSKSSGNLYYNFTINDTTGAMRCCYFTRKAAKGPLDILEEGNEIVVVGDLQNDSFRGGLSLIAKSVSLCRINYSSILSEEDLKRKKTYVPVKAKPLEITTQQNIFDLAIEKPPYLTENTFVVFDLETTGLIDNGNPCKIIEIGAVKIVNGVCTEYFSTLVDPEMHIPESASATNHIYDDMVEDAPRIEDVLPDFLAWVGSSVLVAHNGDKFDFIVLKNEAANQGMYVPNRTKDTIVLAQAYRNKTGRRGQLNLRVLCKEFGIELVEAHRAYFDAYATAQLFIKLFDYVDVASIG